MFQSFVISLREGIGAALVVAIVLVVLKRSGRRDLARSVFRGVGLAVFASFGAAVALSRLPIDKDVYEGVLYFLSALFIGWMWWWLPRKARSPRADLEPNPRPAATSGKPQDGTGAWTLGAFAFLMIFREGAKSATSLSAVDFTTDAMLGFIGSLLGLTLAVVFCVLFVRGSLAVSPRRFAIATHLVLGLFLVQLLVTSYHEFSEVSLLPTTPGTMSLIGPLVRHDLLFTLVMVAIPLWVWLTRLTPPAAEVRNPAEARLALASVRRERRGRTGAIVATLLVLAAVGVMYAREAMPKKVPEPEPVTAENGWVTLPLSKLADGVLHRLGYQSGNKVVRFLAMKTADGKIHTALDACEICGSFGYVQEGKNLVCLNCAAEINPLTMSVGGGCNPIPLPSEVTNDMVRVGEQDLKKAARLFPEVNQTELTSVDPVCVMTVKINEAAAFEIYEGKTYYFCSPHCRDVFRQNPTLKSPMK